MSRNFSTKQRGKSPTKSKSKSNVICFKRNKKGHYNVDCLELKKQEGKSKKKKALKATWDNTLAHRKRKRGKDFKALGANGLE